MPLPLVTPESSSPGSPTDITLTDRRARNTGIRQISSTKSSTTGSPQSVVAAHRTSVSNACRNVTSNFIFASFTGDWGGGRKDFSWWDDFAYPFKGNLVNWDPAFPQRKRKLQRPVHFSETHIGYRALGVLLAWPFSSSILCTAPSQFLQVQNGAHFLNHLFQNLFLSKQILVSYKWRDASHFSRSPWLQSPAALAPWI